MTTTTTIQDIVIDPEYSDIAPKMSDAEFESLKESIAEHGQQVSLTTNAEGVLLDGHNRYRANNELGIKPNAEVKTFQDRSHEKLFVIISAQNRRNLNEAQKAILALKKLQVLKEIGEAHHQATIPKKGQKGFQPVSTPVGGHIGDSAKAAAKDAGIGHGTLRRVKKVMEDGSEEQKQDLLRGVSPCSPLNSLNTTADHDQTGRR